MSPTTKASDTLKVAGPVMVKVQGELVVAALAVARVSICQPDPAIMTVADAAGAMAITAVAQRSPKIDFIRAPFSPYQDSSPRDAPRRVFYNKRKFRLKRNSP